MNLRILRPANGGSIARYGMFSHVRDGAAENRVVTTPVLKRGGAVQGANRSPEPLFHVEKCRTVVLVLVERKGHHSKQNSCSRPKSLGQSISAVILPTAAFRSI
jgi:hypothetical protein